MPEMQKCQKDSTENDRIEWKKLKIYKQNAY